MNLPDLFRELDDTAGSHDFGDSTPVVVTGQVKDVIVSAMIKSVHVGTDHDGCQIVYIELDSDLASSIDLHCASCDGHSC